MENLKLLLSMLDDAMQNHPEHSKEFSLYFDIIEKKTEFDNEAKSIARHVIGFVNE